MGDARSYDFACGLRAVTYDGMTAELGRASRRASAKTAVAPPARIMREGWRM